MKIQIKPTGRFIIGADGVSHEQLLVCAGAIIFAYIEGGRVKSRTRKCFVEGSIPEAIAEQSGCTKEEAIDAIRLYANEAQPELEYDSNNETSKNTNLIQNKSSESLPFFAPNTRTVACGHSMETLLDMANVFWPKLLEMADPRFFLVIDVAKDAGLQIAINGAGPEYGQLVVRMLETSFYEITADTVLHDLDGSTESRNSFTNIDLAVNWTIDFIQRVFQLDQFWSDELIYRSARERYVRKYGDNPQW